MTAAAPDVSPPGRAELYAGRRARFEAVAEALGARSRLVSNLRGLSFGTAVIALVIGTLGSTPGALPVSAVAAALFVAFVAWHGGVIAREDTAVRLTRVNIDARARVTDAWHELPNDGARFADDAHPYTSDIDVFGRGSLYQRINVARTRFGQEALAGFLKAPAEPPVIAERQEAARALAPLLEERQELESLAMAVVEPLGQPSGRGKAPSEPPDPEPLLRWAEGAAVLSGRGLLRAAAFALPPITLFLLFGARALGLPGSLWLAPFALQVLAVSAARGEADRVFGAVSSTQGAFLRYGPMFDLVERLKVGAPLVQRLRDGLTASPVRPSQAMREFERIVSWFELRHTGLIHPFANAFLLWDLHCVLRLEAWQARAGRGARGWFRALGEVEALSSFAALAHDARDFTWPELTLGPAHFEAEGLGHPLLPGTRVTNDVTLTGAGRSLLVTGSNMSGKSTFLRSIGLSAVMALAGSPVCARRLRLSPVAVRTSIRIADSLARGVSHFYAEVARLKGVVDSTQGAFPVLFLLDEILHGTNSEERKTGARWILAELLSKGALGAVSTHDQGLCQLPPGLMERVAQCHFRETVQEGRMTFDYKLRSGPVSGGNALRLMRLVGLDVPEA